MRPNTLTGYRYELKPVIDHLGSMPLQQLRTADIDALVTLRMAGKPVAQRDKRGRRSAEVLAWLRARPDGASFGEMYAEFGNPGERALARLVASGEVVRPARGRYAAARPADPERPKVAGGVSARTIVSMLVVLSSALDHATPQGLVARNVARQVKRPKLVSTEMATWTPEQASTFRAHVAGDRLAACWLLTLAGLRRSEVLGLRWADVDLDAGTITVAQGRVVVGGGTVTGAPKSTRSARTLPMPRDVLAALRAFKTRQAEEHLALGGGWPDTGLVAVERRRLPHPARDLLEGLRRPLRSGEGVGDPAARRPAHRRHDAARRRHHPVGHGQVAGPRPGDHAAGLRPRLRRRAGVGGRCAARSVPRR